jgi:hypothetical protein
MVDAAWTGPRRSHDGGVCRNTPFTAQGGAAERLNIYIYIYLYIYIYTYIYIIYIDTTQVDQRDKTNEFQSAATFDECSGI